MCFFLQTLVMPSAASARDYHIQEISVAGREHRVEVPRGYRLELLTTRLEGPRLFTFATNGDLLLGSKSGRVYRIAPPYRRPEVLVRLPDYPHSVALREGEIFISRTTGLYRAPYHPGQERLDPDRLSLVAPLPGGGGHTSRTVHTGPDGRLYVSLGISGNCSDQYLGADYPFSDRRGGILVLDENADPPRLEPFASGFRNPVGFDWHPQTGVLYASNNGPDHLGFEQPPEYFSRVSAGSFHGMPWFQFDGERLRRDRCIERAPPRPAAEVVTPVATFAARSAPMGVAFVPEGALDERFENDAIVALHGSWGTQPSGGRFGSPATRRPPKLVRVRFSKGEAGAVEDLVTGFQLKDGERWARPVGVTPGPDGALYFTSDGGTHALYRLRPLER
jgi:glucose/arabinose dehydrogenase